MDYVVEAVTTLCKKKGTCVEWVHPLSGQVRSGS